VFYFIFINVKMHRMFFVNGSAWLMKEAERQITCRLKIPTKYKINSLKIKLLKLQEYGKL